MDSVWETTLAALRERVSAGPTPAAVSVSAVAATMGLALLRMVLEVSSRRKDFVGDRARTEELSRRVAAESARLMQYADRDIATFDVYLRSLRMAKDSAAQADARADAIAAALHDAIEVPLASARSVASGINLCVEAADIAAISVAADLAAATALLAAALRATLLSVNSNLRRLGQSDNPYRGKVAAERRQLEIRIGRAEEVLSRLTKLLGE